MFSQKKSLARASGKMCFSELKRNIPFFFYTTSLAITGRQGVEEKLRWTLLTRWVGQCLWSGRRGSFRRWRWWLASWRGGPLSRVSPLARRAPSRRKWCSPSGGKLCASTGTRPPVQQHKLQVGTFRQLQFLAVHCIKSHKVYRIWNFIRLHYSTFCPVQSTHLSIQPVYNEY